MSQDEDEDSEEEGGSLFDWLIPCFVISLFPYKNLYFKIKFKSSYLQKFEIKNGMLLV